MQQFSINIADENGTEKECSRYDQIAPPGSHVTLVCPKPLIGRYVHFARYGGPQIGDIALCEVVVIGHRYINCSEVICSEGSSCNDVTGCETCLGAYPPSCKTECANGVYATNCSEECGQCDGGQTCDRLTGVCSRCALWYAGSKCTVQISYPVILKEAITKSTTTPYTIFLEWETLGSINPDLIEHYQYAMKFKDHRAANYSNGIVVGHTSSGIARGTIVGLHPGRLYDVIIVPQRVMRGVSEASPDGANFGPITVITQSVGTVPSTFVHYKITVGDLVASGAALLGFLIMIVVFVVLIRRSRSRNVTMPYPEAAIDLGILGVNNTQSSTVRPQPGVQGGTQKPGYHENTTKDEGIYEIPSIG